MDSGCSAGSSIVLQFHRRLLQQGETCSQHGGRMDDGGKVWINEGRLVTDGATPVDGCFNSASRSTSRLCYLSGRRGGTPRLNYSTAVFVGSCFLLSSQGSFFFIPMSL